MIHDDYCQLRHNPDLPESVCSCDFITEVRADEREKASTPDSVHTAIAAMSEADRNYLFGRLAFSHRHLTYRGGWEAAYRRGREDAVQSVGVELLGQYGDTVNSALHEAVSAAARGDVPCAHSRTQYTREICWCGDAVDVCDDCGVDVHECADGADTGNRNASVPEDATPHAALTTLDDRK